MQCRTFFQCAGETSRERHLKSVEYPRGSKCRHHQRVEAAPWQPVEPRGDIRFDDLLILHHERRVDFENGLTCSKRSTAQDRPGLIAMAVTQNKVVNRRNNSLGASRSVHLLMPQITENQGLPANYLKLLTMVALRICWRPSMTGPEGEFVTRSSGIGRCCLELFLSALFG